MPQTVIVTAATENKKDHLLNLRKTIQMHAPEVTHLIVTVGEEPWEPWEDADTVFLKKKNDEPFNISLCRNVGLTAAAEMGAENLIMLDADCMVGKDTIRLYVDAIGKHTDGVICGPVNWMTPAPDGGYDLDSLDENSTKEFKRQFPDSGKTVKCDESEWWTLFGLSFAMSASAWQKSVDEFGGFCEEFDGWGLDDTDYGYQIIRSKELDLYLLGGAIVFHQFHTSYVPPVDKAKDLAKNSNLFWKRNGYETLYDVWLLELMGFLLVDEENQTVKLMKEPPSDPLSLPGVKIGHLEEHL